MKTIDVKYASGVQHVTINNGVYQYDHGITLQVHGLSTGPVPDFHFGIDGSTKSISVTPTRTDGVVSAQIPDAVLMQHRQVWCYVYIESNGSGYTSFEIRIPIIARPKPADYTYTAEQIDSYNQLQAQLNAELEIAKGFADTVAEVHQSITDIEDKVTANESGQKETSEKVTAIEKGYAKREDIPSVVQESGNSEDAVMSQKAVSEALSSLEEQVVEIASGSSAPPIVLQASGGTIVLNDASTRPVQALTSQIGYSATGWTSVQAHSTGRNLLSKTPDDVVGIPYTNTSGESRIAYGYDILLPAGDYTVCAPYKTGENNTSNMYMYVLALDANGSLVFSAEERLVSGATVKSVKVSLAEGQRLIIYHSATAVSTVKERFGRVNIGIYLDGADTTYTDYIGATLTAEFPATIYGGTFDWGTGTLTSTLDSTGAALAAPQVYTLTPQLFNSHSGYNVIWSDCGTTQVHYIADTKTYIDARIAAIAASIINV